MEVHRENLHGVNPLGITRQINMLPDSCDLSEGFTLVHGCAALELFVRENFTGPSLVEQLPEWARESQTIHIDGEPTSPLARGLPLLTYAHDVFTSVLNDSSDTTTQAVCHWWLWRYAQVMQQVVGSDKCPSLLKLFSAAFSAIQKSDLIAENGTKLLFLVEAIHTTLEYYQYDAAIQCMNEFQTHYGKKFSLSGALGKRTRFQQDALAQLYVKIESTKKVEKSSFDKAERDGSRVVDVVLEDEAVLHRIKFDDASIEEEMGAITPLGHAGILAKLWVEMKTGPSKERLNEEEQLAMVDFILANPRCASYFTVSEALRYRSKLEVYKFSKVERGMKQLQAVADLYTSQQISELPLQFFYTSKVPPRWVLRKELCDSYIKLGLTKAAVDEYIALEMWEDTCYCYIANGMNTKAEELANKCLEMDIDDARKANFWCIKGDLNDSIEFYQKGWEMSKKRHARSMRSMGALLVHLKRYEEAADAFKSALELNHLQPGTWFALGCASLICGRYSDAAKAFRRCVTIEYDNYEAWANLANSELKSGNKPAAHRCLAEAIKCNYDKWELWENFVTIAIDCGDFNGAIRGYVRLLEIHPKKDFKDIAVLNILTKAIVENLKDCSGKPARNELSRMKDLLHKVVSVRPSFKEAWGCYAEISMVENVSESDPLKILSNRATILQKAVRALMTDDSWHLVEQKCSQLCSIVKDLAAVGISDLEGATTLIGGPTRLALKSFGVKLRKARTEKDSELLMETEVIVSSAISSIEARLR